MLLASINEQQNPGLTMTNVRENRVYEAFRDASRIDGDSVSGVFDELVRLTVSET